VFPKEKGAGAVPVEGGAEVPNVNGTVVEFAVDPPKVKAAGAATDVLALLLAGVTDVFVLPNVKAGATTLSVVGKAGDTDVGGAPN